MSQQAEGTPEDEDNYRPSGKREWAHELSVGIAAALNLFDPPEVVDEALIARVLRGIALESAELGHSLFIRALADALDHPKAERKLTLSRGRRGRPDNGTKVERALAVGPVVERLVRRGWKKEAAVQQAMMSFGISRAAVLRSCSEYKRLSPIFNGVQMNFDAQRHRYRRKSIK